MKTYACEVSDAIELEAQEIHSWNAMVDEDAFVARGVRILADGVTSGNRSAAPGCVPRVE